MNNKFFDFGGPFLLLFLFGIPIALIIVIIALIVLTVHLIKKAKKKSSEKKDSDVTKQ